jgi:hypothetical protein
MSYEIIYDKQFIKLPDNNYIPMIYAGSSNCYEWTGKGGKERRSRSWFPTTFVLGGHAYGTPEAMLASVEKIRKEYFERERSEPVTEDKFNKNFGYYLGMYIRGSRNTTFGMYEGIFKTGIKKARTIEDLLSHNISVDIHSYAYDNDKMKAAGLEPFSIVPKTGEEFIRVYNEKKAEFGAKGYDIYVSMDADEWQMKQLRKEFKTANPSKRVKKEKVITEEFVIRYPNNGYFARATRNGFRYHYFLSTKTPRFYTLAAAEKKAKALNERFYQKDFVVERIELLEPKTVLV